MSLTATMNVVGPPSIVATPERVTLTWRASALAGLAATIERREIASDFVAIGEATADGVGTLSFADTTVSPGGRYAYRLTWLDDATQRTTSEAWVDVPVEPAAGLALYGARPNPASRREGMFISLALPDDAPATLELLDVAGRRLVERRLSGAGPHRVNVSEGMVLDRGIYFVRLTHGGRSLTSRVTVSP